MKLRNILISIASLAVTSSATVCTVPAAGNASIDDAPAIISAFKECGQNGQVIFLNETYHVNTVMNTTGLKNVTVDLQGTLLWNTNFTYWLNASLPVGYQNQSSAWIFGGDDIVFDGNGYGTLNGSGSAWYTFIDGQSNYPGRPHAITIANSTNSVFKGIRFVQSQMWTMTVIHSKDILLEDIYVNNLSNSGKASSNTDGANTIYADNITFTGWSVTNGDDSIAIKANSTNIVVKDSVFSTGLGLAFGSIGQYKGVFETIQNITATNITCSNTLHASYIKTWTGQQVNFPPNGGGGGLGFLKNVSLTNFSVSALTGTPFSITQCTTFSGAAGACNSSLFEIEDFSLAGVAGSAKADPIASLQCSAAAPCTRVGIEDVDLTLANGTAMSGYNCDAVVDQVGFNCTGSACEVGTATGSC